MDVIEIAKELSEAKQAGMTQSPPVAFAEDVEDAQMAESLSMSLQDYFSDGFAGAEALLVPDYPFIEAEVIFGVRHDWVVRPEDFLARRSRLAYLNKEAAMRAIPRVVQLMAQELKWSRARQSAEILRCVEFMRHFGGSKSAHLGTTMRLATRADLLDVYRKAKAHHAQGLTRDTLRVASEMLNHILTEEELADCLHYAEEAVSIPARNGTPPTAVPPGVVTFESFSSWWNSERHNPELVEMKQNKSANVEHLEGSGALFG